MIFRLSRLLPQLFVATSLVFFFVVVFLANL